MRLRIALGIALSSALLVSSGPAFGAMDVKLGILNDMQAPGRTGTYPNGLNGLSMATTSCNVGTIDCPWEAAMDEDHPSIAMALYYEKDGVFRQAGISWMKHGFFALSNNQCTPCQHPSGGDFLGVGCSDTYSSGNNSDRDWLGPRSEINPFKATWECTGSFFSGGQPDCVRRVWGGGFNGAEHRVEVLDAELGLSGATYYYEGYYVVANDVNRINNIGSRRCVPSWSGTKWNFSTPGGGNDLVEGPASARWGDTQNWGNVAVADGQAVLSAKVTDLGGGQWHYEYCLFNFDSERRIKQLTIPVGNATISNIGFNDIDENAVNDWAVVVDNGEISWSTGPFEDPNSNPIMFGTLYNFRFDANVDQAAVTAEMFPWKTAADMNPGTVATVGPGINPAGVEEVAAAAGVKLSPNRPNPLVDATTIHFEIAQEQNVRLDIFDLTGRQVRSLMSGTARAGGHDVSWDGTTATGERVAAGQYYYRLETNAATLVRSLLILK